MKMFIVCSFGMAFFWAVGLVAEEGNKETPVQTERVPADYRCVSDAAVKDLHPFTRAHVVWPDAESIGKSKVESTNRQVQAAIRLTTMWVTNTLRPEVTTAEPEVLALKGDAQGHDVIRFRYKVRDAVVEVASTASRLTLVIDPVNKRVPENLKKEEAKQYVDATIEEFLQQPDKVKASSLLHITRVASGYKGAPEVKPETCNFWWGLVDWWTDGKIVVFSFLKADGGAMEPAPEKHWFSQSEENE